jgi:hypothetical protein
MLVLTNYALGLMFIYRTNVAPRATREMLEPDLAERIRRIFLQPRPHVSIMTATGSSAGQPGR